MQLISYIGDAEGISGGELSVCNYSEKDLMGHNFMSFKNKVPLRFELRLLTITPWNHNYRSCNRQVILNALMMDSMRQSKLKCLRFSG